MFIIICKVASACYCACAHYVMYIHAGFIRNTAMVSDSNTRITITVIAVTSQSSSTVQVSIEYEYYRL